MTPRKRLTAIAVERLRPRSTRREIPDPAARGLYLVVQPSGRKRFVVRYRLPGGRSRKLTLPAGLELADARRAAADAMAEVERGRDPAAHKQTSKAQAEAAAANTLRAVAEIYLHREEHKPADKRLRTIGQRRATFERLIYPRLGGRPIADIRRSEIVALLDDVEAKRGGRMADEVLGCLRILMNWHAKRADDYVPPVIRGMTLTKPQDRMRNRVLTDDEIVRVWTAAESLEGFGLYIQFLLLTATRRNEAAKMTYSELNNGDWLIPAARYKNKRNHLIPLSRAAQAVLAKVPWLEGCDYVFTGDGKHAIAGFSRLKVKLDRASGVTGWRLHDLRRSARSLMSAAGVNPDHAERCLGHALAGVRKTYDRHAFRDEKLAAFEALAARIEHLVNPQENVVPMPRRR